MAYTTAESKALANQAERGNNRSLGNLLRDIVDKTGALSVAELAWLDGVTAGTALASKAMVLDSSGNIAMPSTGLIGLSRAALAAAGTTAADAGAIATQVVAVTASDGTKGVVLPAAATTLGPILVINTVLTSGGDLKVYPVNGGNDQINGGAEDAAFTMGPGKAAWFIPTSATQWYAEDLSGVTATATELNTMDGILATTAELNRAADVSTRIVTLTGDTSITEASHEGKVLLLGEVGGNAALAATLPAATGSGGVYRFIVSVVNTSGYTIRVVGDDIMAGNIIANSTGDTPDLAQPWPTAADSDTITLDGTTTGGVSIGDWIELVDILANTWAVRGVVTASGAEATPFSAAVT